MPFYKISTLTTATAVSATNQFEINQNGASRSVEVSVLGAYIRSDSTLPIAVSVSSATAALQVTQAGSGAALEVSLGKVGIGTATPDYSLTIQANDAAISLKDGAGTTRGYVGVAGIVGTAPTGAIRFRSDQGGFVFAQNGTETGRLDDAGNLKFNSGYGSVATAYGCRAWVNFNGTGTVAIRASGNVSSITDHGTGDYTVNFTTAMPDADYAWTSSGADNDYHGDIFISEKSAVARAAASLRVIICDLSPSPFDAPAVCIAVFR